MIYGNGNVGGSLVSIPSATDGRILTEDQIDRIKSVIASQEDRFEMIANQLNEHYGDLVKKYYSIKPVPMDFARWYFSQLLSEYCLSEAVEPSFEDYIDFCDVIIQKIKDRSIQMRMPNKLDRKSDKEKEDITANYLAFMCGVNYKEERILGDEDFEYLITKSKDLVLSGKCPEITKQIKPNGLSADSLRYIYSSIHDCIYRGRWKNQEYIIFLHDIFHQFNGYNRNTTLAKFRMKTKAFPFSNY